MAAWSEGRAVVVVGADRVDGGLVRRVGREAAHRLAHLAGRVRPHRRRRGAGDLVVHRRPLVGFQPVQRLGQAIDRIRGRRPAGVAAGVGRRQVEVGIGLLGALDAIGHRLAVLGQAPAAAVGVQHQFGVLQPLGQDGRGPHVGLLVARQRQDHVAAGLPALLAEVGEGGDHHRDVELVVRRAAAEDIAVLDDRRERVAGPVGRLGLHHVHMARNDDRLLLRVLAGIAGDQERRAGHRLDRDLRGAVAAGHQLALQILRVRHELVAAGHGAIADAGLQDLQRLVVQGGIDLGLGERGRGESGGEQGGEKRLGHVGNP